MTGSGKNDEARRSIKLEEPNGNEIKKLKKPKKNSDKSWVRSALTRPLASIIIGVIIAGLVVTFVGVNLYHAYFSPVDSEGEEKIVVIDSGSSLSTIADVLEDEGIIRSSTVFKYYVDFSNMASKLRAGTYKLTTDMTFDEIIDTLKKSNNKNVTSRITFTEGSTIADYAKLLETKGVFNNELTFQTAAQSGEDYSSNIYISELLDDKDAISNRRFLLEGYLYPETYEIYSDASPSQIISKMLDQFSLIFTDDMAERAADLNMSVDEVVILASIIEKEAKTADFAKVSAVFHNRLNKGMKLESCATHQYFMNENKLVWTQAELAVSSPYNTYLNEGLPAGPICNPGKNALNAALYPDEDMMEQGYLYFCLGDPDEGTLYFSKTLEEHEAYKAKYQSLWQEYDAQQENETT